MRLTLMAFSVVAVAGAAAGSGALHVYRQAGPLPEPRDVVVPHGGLETVGGALASAGVIRHVLPFRLAALVTIAEGPIRAAELHFPAGASLERVLAVLRNGRAIEHRLTIAEGLEAAQIARVIARQGALLPGDVTVPDEGAVLPQTYAFQRGTSAAGLSARAEAAMRATLAEEWRGRAPGLPLHSPEEALILASIVEHEARLPAERPMIARVFLNRLAMGMRLQADPTAAYAAEGGMGVLARPLSKDDLAEAGPYNTYVVAGLPAGPICSPGVASLHAVLHPAAGDALYFVADGTGGHVFSASLAAHHVNVARYRAENGEGHGAAVR
jgi:UPF0755 protein